MKELNHKKIFKGKRKPLENFSPSSVLSMKRFLVLKRSIKSAKIIKRVIFLVKTNGRRDAAERINLFSIKHFPFAPFTKGFVSRDLKMKRVKATDGGVTFYKTIICQPESFPLALLKSSRRRSDSVGSEKRASY